MNITRPDVEPVADRTRKRRLSIRVPIENTRSCPVRWRMRSANGPGGSVTTISTACGTTATTWFDQGRHGGGSDRAHSDD
ncbi:hypothetical protein [Streptomyces chiangmaiensis]|uniref:Uncharacterized protein n=1 Tax=Streptomyces chiangmaiensis TaxID=766497 RepID=A0ABU7FCB9_9ACTN|nr:hypothetical protein [Streptomyces chiangmaiensis]MED7821822.1 hypothetical protein [Streptomyces chiangmaiensis]